MSIMNPNGSDSSINSQNMDASQAFDPETLFKIAIEILRKPSGIRTKSDINFLINAFKEITFFAKLYRENGFDHMKNLCKALGHQRFNDKDIVFNIGEVGFTFYIILKGAVGVLIPDYRNFGELREIATLYQGQSFGDMALLLEQPRNATIVCKDKCEFATLTRDAFNETLAKIEMKKINDKIDFFASLPIFKMHTRRQVSTLINHFEHLILQKGEVIYNVGDEPLYAYVIMKGEVKLRKQIVAEEKFNFEVPDDFYQQKQPKKHIDLVILGEKEMFGEEDICHGTKRSNLAVVSSLKADIYRISRTDFEKRILSAEETAIPVIVSSKNKLDWREGHLKEVEEVSNKTRNYFYSPEKPVPTKEKRPKTTQQEPSSPPNEQNTIFKTTTINLNQTTVEKGSGLFLTENSFITSFALQEPPKRERTPSPIQKKRPPPVPKLQNLFGEKPDAKVKAVTLNVGIEKATKNFKKQLQLHLQKQTRNQQEIKQLFKYNVFEKVEHKSRLINRKNLNQTADYYRNKSAKDPKYITSKPVEKKIKIEDQHFSQVEAKERILSGIKNGSDRSEKLFDFAEMLRLHKPKAVLGYGSLPPKKAATFSVSAEPTIVERILQSNEFFREKNRPFTSQNTPHEPFINMHMRNYREKSLFPRSKPKFLTPKTPQKMHIKVPTRDPNFRSAKLEGSPIRRDSSGTGNLDIRALRTSGFSPF